MKYIFWILIIVSTFSLQGKNNFSHHPEVTVQPSEYLRDYATFVGVFRIDTIVAQRSLSFIKIEDLHKSSPDNFCVSLSDLESDHLTELQMLSQNQEYIVGSVPHKELTGKNDECNLIIELIEFAHMNFFIIERNEITEQLLLSGIRDNDDDFIPMIDLLLERLPYMNPKEQIFCSLEIYFRRAITKKYTEQNWEIVENLIENNQINDAAKHFMLQYLWYNKEAFGVSNLLNLVRNAIDIRYIEKLEPNKTDGYFFFGRTCISVLRYEGNEDDIERLKRLVRSPYQRLSMKAFVAISKINKQTALDYGQQLLGVDNNFLSQDKKYYLTQYLKKLK